MIGLSARMEGLVERLFGEEERVGMRAALERDVADVEAHEIWTDGVFR